MAVAFLRSNGKSSFGASDNIASNAIEVAAGDLVVVMVGGNISTDAPTITDSESNSYTHRDLISSTNAFCRVAYSYRDSIWDSCCQRHTHDYGYR
ncbi:hypothetical protein LCGC14_1906230 [marine sediment metagenome]|uniref:Uncharacterized protein n=1 Tax=marine sediment metagenome TaxID=412755 RepID=A0A0F9IT97_9ZZZZ